MRIGTRLLLVNLAVVLLVGLLLLGLTPVFTRQALRSSAAQTLAAQAVRLSRLWGQQRATGIALRAALGLIGADALVVDANLQVQTATASGDAHWEALEGHALPELLAQHVRQAIRLNRQLALPLVTLPGGPQRVVGVAPLRSAGGAARGAVILSQPVPELFAQAGGRVEGSILRITLGAVLLTAAISALTSRALVRRLARVGAAAHAVAEGDLSTRVPAQGNDEITDLAKSFNHMAERVSALVGGLQESERLRRDLMASIAHELRTPTTSIRGFAEALRDGVVPEDRRTRYYEIIANESARLARLIQDLFDLAKLDAGQLEFRLQPLDLAAWVPQFAESQRHRLEQAGLALAVRVPPAVAPVLADQDRLEQVLHNLIDNAARYAPPGSAITLEMVPGQGEVQVAVQDQGPGIPAEEAEHIWERFYQGKDPGKRKGGAGLGLAIVKSFVAAHGGRVGLDGRPGAGARFWFALPVAAPAGPSAATPRPGSEQAPR